MKKYILKSTGREVKLGDTLCKKGFLLGIPCIVEVFTLNEAILKDLIHSGLIEEVETKITIEDIILHIAGRIKWNPVNVAKYLDNLYKINQASVCNILLKELSIIFDKDYKGHIEDCEEIWAISSFDGKTFKVDKSRVKTCKNFAAFRSEEDAIRAKKILEVPFKEVYGE